MVNLPVLDLTAAEMRVYVSPFHDIKTAYLSFLRTAQKSIHVSIFGFHVPELTDELIAAHRRGLTVDCIFDHGQAEGKAELPELKRLVDAGVPILIGTSFVEGQLLHAKVTVVDEEWVEQGSWNYSESATKQLNTAEIIHHAGLAQSFLLARDVIRAYIVRHEQIFQPRGAIPTPAALASDVGRDAELDPAPGGKQVKRKDVARPWLENAKAGATA